MVGEVRRGEERGTGNHIKSKCLVVTVCLRYLLQWFIFSGICRGRERECTEGGENEWRRGSKRRERKRGRRGYVKRLTTIK